MFRKIVDVLKEVFWLKPSRKKSKSTRRKKVSRKKAIKKKIVNKQVSKPVASKSVKTTLTLKKAVSKPLERPIKPSKKALEPVKKLIPAKKIVPEIDPSLVQVGEITHFFERIKVCVVKITQGSVLIGDKLTIIGPKTKYVQKVWSMQIESVDVKVAKKGQLIGLKVDKLIAVGDKVYK